MALAIFDPRTGKTVVIATPDEARTDKARDQGRAPKPGPEAKPLSSKVSR